MLNSQYPIDARSLCARIHIYDNMYTWITSNINILQLKERKDFIIDNQNYYLTTSAAQKIYMRITNEKDR